MTTWELEVEKFNKKLEGMTGCSNCPYNAHGVISKAWQDRADHVVGPCGQQHCWLELGNKS